MLVRWKLKFIFPGGATALINSTIKEPQFIFDFLFMSKVLANNYN